MDLQKEFLADVTAMTTKGGGGFRNSDFDVIGILISHFSLVFDFFSAALESYGRLIFARAFTR